MKVSHKVFYGHFLNKIKMTLQIRLYDNTSDIWLDFYKDDHAIILSFLKNFKQKIIAFHEDIYIDDTLTSLLVDGIKMMNKISHINIFDRSPIYQKEKNAGVIHLYPYKKYDSTKILYDIDIVHKKIFIIFFFDKIEIDDENIEVLLEKIKMYEIGEKNGSTNNYSTK